MEQEDQERLQQLADYLILNGYSKEMSGLYFGKAGISLVLFEIARALENEWIDDHAFEFMNQSLLSKTTKFDLDNGLGGIAYALQYAIDRQFIDADFDELFGEQMKLLCQNFKEANKYSIERLHKLGYWVYVFNCIQPQANEANLNEWAFRYWKEEYELANSMIQSILREEVVNNHQLKQHYHLLSRLTDQWLQQRTLPDEILKLRKDVNQTVRLLYEEGYWAYDFDIIKPIPLTFREMAEVTDMQSKDEYKTLIQQSRYSIKSSLFEGIGRWALLELKRIGMGTNRTSELLNLPDFAAVSHEINDQKEKMKI